MGLFDSGSAKTKPLAWQQAPVRDVFARSKTATDRLSKAGAPKVGMFAGFTDPTRTGVNQLTDFANGVGGELGGSIAISAKEATAAGAGYGGTASALWSRYGNGGAAEAIQAGTAGFMNDPLLQQQIDAVTGDIARSFGEDAVLLDSDAAASGNATNTRAGVERAIAQRGAQDRAASVAAGLRSDAYGRAQALAADAYNTDANYAFDASAGLGDAARTGAGLSGDALSINGGVAGQNLQAGGILQQENQRALDEARALHRERNGGYQLDLQRQLYDIVGGQTWGSQTEGGDGGLGSRLLGTGLALAPAVAGAAFGGPAGLMMGLGASGAGLSNTWGGGAASAAAVPSSTGMSSGFGRGANGLLGRI